MFSILRFVVVYSHTILVTWRQALNLLETSDEANVSLLSGFFGQAAHIVFILCVKEELSDSAKLSWGFGFGFLATGTAAVSSLAMTKAHSRPLPRLQPPSASEERQTADVPLSNVETARGAASSPRASGQPQPRAPRDRRSREAVGYL